ncbi:MAG TPA: hypothetical protein VHS06_06385, partial [Chloroflexota bacterium]|nr:hypothetical protein [Chloroflexota bacterium]
TSELTAEQVAKKGLEEGDIDWEAATEPRLQPASAKDQAGFSEEHRRLKQLVVEMNGCERARRDIAGWRRDIQIRSRGGNLGLRLSDGFLEITDLFCLPTSELTAEQVAKKGLEEGDIDWEAATEPRLQPASAKDQAGFSEEHRRLKQLVVEMNGCERARRDIAGWQRDIQVKSRGGNLGLRLSDGFLEITEGEIGSPDFVMVCDDLSVLTRSLAYQGSLTQAIINRELWISKNGEFTTVFKLERMARSLARSRKG